MSRLYRDPDLYRKIWSLYRVIKEDIKLLSMVSDDSREALRIKILKELDELWSLIRPILEELLLPDPRRLFPRDILDRSSLL